MEKLTKAIGTECVSAADQNSWYFGANIEFTCTKVAKVKTSSFIITLYNSVFLNLTLTITFGILHLFGHFSFPWRPVKHVSSWTLITFITMNDDIGIFFATLFKSLILVFCHHFKLFWTDSINNLEFKAIIFKILNFKLI